MALRYLVSLSLAVAVVADQSSHVSISLGGAPAVSHHSSSHHARTSYHHQPTYHTQSSNHPQPSYHPAPAYHPQPSYEHEHEPAVPECAANTTKPWCLEDDLHPTYEIKHAAEYHYKKLLSLYADVAELNTELSVDRPNSLDEETYLCPSETAYVRPLRAQNTEGKWRVVVNNIDAHYQTLTQTTRIEECLTSADACPLVPECYQSKCLQKSIYHRFLVYNPYDQYFPFAIETFKLPASCACLLGAYTIDHYTKIRDSQDFWTRSSQAQEDMHRRKWDNGRLEGTMIWLCWQHIQAQQARVHALMKVVGDKREQGGRKVVDGMRAVYDKKTRVNTGSVPAVPRMTSVLKRRMQFSSHVGAFFSALRVNSGCRWFRGGHGVLDARSKGAASSFWEQTSFEAGSLAVIVNVVHNDTPLAIHVLGTLGHGIHHFGGTDITLRTSPVSDIVGRVPSGGPTVVRVVEGLLLVLVAADQTSHVSISFGGAPAVSHHSSSHHARPSYHHQPTYHAQSSYHPQPSYYPAPAYHPQPSYEHEHEPAVPECAANTTKPWCLEDDHYPTYEIKHAAEYHYEKLLSLYADVADLNTELSVDRPNSLDEETYLCPSETAYVRPLRAQNTEGKWRVVVNNIDAHYQTLTQTARIEECLTSADACPLVPDCYESKCLQKSIYHRFLVYNPYDQYFPFAIETFKLPASCACLLGAYTIDH
ncbi:uncharacterized protein LOC125027809 [Penaeus chinensis]|uniref:uncharacterized protein LOC125027809 n=1 Tax=Penaeus chinensis TaxID=139456 RepID=UPI001FB7E645|nr:uncharacterized protein LOC125027809 [Penaeus chinensis]